MNHRILTLSCFIQTIVHFLGKSSANIARSLCDASLDICEFRLTLGYHTAMIKYNEDENSMLMDPVTVFNNGSIFLRDARTCALGESMEQESRGNIFNFCNILLHQSW